MGTYTVLQLAYDDGVSVHVVRTAFETGIGLDVLAWLCRALDAAGGDINLVTAAVVLWNTVYLEHTIHALRGNGHATDDMLLQYLSP